METGLKKESPITYSNGKRLFTIDQKVDALVRIKMTGCSKAEVARSLHVAESTFRGWFKNKDIVMKAEVKYQEIKCKTTSSASSSDGYKSEDGDNSSIKSSRSAADGGGGGSAAEECCNNNADEYAAPDDRENSRSRFGSPDLPVAAVVPPQQQQQQQQPLPLQLQAVAAPVRRSPERVRSQHHHKQKLKKQPSNGGLLSQQQLNAAIVNNNNSAAISNNNNNNNSLHIGALAAAAAAAGINGFAGMNGALQAAGNHCAGLPSPQQQLHHQLAQLAQHPLHQNLSSLGGLKGTNAAAAFAAAAAMAAAAAANDPANLKLSPAELHSKLNSYFNPSPLHLATSLPGAINFLPPNFTTAENSYNQSSFINTMVTATLMEPQALDLSTHSRNKTCKDTVSSLTANAITSAGVTTTTPHAGQKILRHNSYRKLFKPYKSRCTDDVVHTRQGINPRNPLWPLQ